MKTLLSMLLLAGASTVTCDGQGRIMFDNFEGGIAPVTISTNAGGSNPTDGPAGSSISLLLLGIVSLAVFRRRLKNNCLTK
jgi:hypothetical protein